MWGIFEAFLGIIVLSAADCKLKLAMSVAPLSSIPCWETVLFFFVFFNNAGFWLHSIPQYGTCTREDEGEAGRPSRGLQWGEGLIMYMQHIWLQPKDKQDVPYDNAVHDRLILLK